MSERLSRPLVVGILASLGLHALLFVTSSPPVPTVGTGAVAVQYQGPLAAAPAPDQVAPAPAPPAQARPQARPEPTPPVGPRPRSSTSHKPEPPVASATASVGETPAAAPSLSAADMGGRSLPEDGVLEDAGNEEGAVGAVTEWAGGAEGVNPSPRYPWLARLRGWEGEVRLLVRVDPAGRVAGVVVESGSGHASLDQEALATVSRWTFPPQDGAGLRQVRVPISFRLRR